jgi:dihydrofolate reductase
MTPSLIVIAAIARNGVIGRGNALVWRDPVDAKHFRAVTMGSPVVMGRKTWDSLPPKFKPLPGRLNLVVTRDPMWRAEGAQKALGLLDALAQAQQASSAGSTLNPTREASISAARGTHPSTAPRTYVIGGAQLYAQALPLADELVLTEIDRDIDGDIRFPTWDREGFDEVHSVQHVDSQGTPFRIVRYRRRAGAPAP